MISIEHKTDIRLVHFYQQHHQTPILFLGAIISEDSYALAVVDLFSLFNSKQRGITITKLMDPYIIICYLVATSVCLELKGIIV